MALILAIGGGGVSGSNGSKGTTAAVIVFTFIGLVALYMLVQFLRGKRN